MNKLNRAYTVFEDFFSGLMLFSGLSMIMINVTLRYVWGRPESLLDEFSVYFVVWGTMAGFAVALRTNHHIKVDFVYDMFKPRKRRYISIFANIVGLAFTMFYTVFGYQLVRSYIISGQNSSDSQFPLWIVNLIMPISGLMLGVRFIEKLYHLLKDEGRTWHETQHDWTEEF